VTDPNEESRVFADCHPALRRFAAVVGPDECDPDDLVQESVARVLRHHRLDELEEPMAHLRRTAVNLASNERRGFAIGAGLFEVQCEDAERHTGMQEGGSWPAASWFNRAIQITGGTTRPTRLASAPSSARSSGHSK
jgi:hypothetical protein